MDITLLYEDNDVLVIDKPPGMVVFSPTADGSPNETDIEEENVANKTVIEALLEKYPELKNVERRPDMELFTDSIKILLASYWLQKAPRP